jgi:soluble lytic murein transglycosylase
MFKRSKCLSYFFVILLLSGAQADAAGGRSEDRPDAQKIRSAQSLAEQGQGDLAVSQLNELINQETVISKRALFRLSQALILFRLSRDAEAEQQFTQALKDGLRVEEVAHYHLGLLARKSGQIDEAQKYFSRVLEGRATRQTELEAKLQLGEIQIEKKNWRAARVIYEGLRRQLKGKDVYPEVLLNLLRSEQSTQMRGNGCKWARELYAKYPSHPSIKDWGVALENNLVGGKRTGCLAGAADLKTRIRRLQLSGEAERAVAELKSLKSGMDVERTYHIDAILANHLIGDGQVTEAMSLLLRHYETQKSRPPYMNLLAKAAARAGEYQTAIGAYDRAYELSPRGRKSDNALFQAAFACYQIQDYDGATRRFQKLVREFPRARLSRDSQWHLAWIRYLRDDYQGAYESFSKLAQLPKKATSRRRRGAIRSSVAADALSADRLRYWSAMSLLKLGRKAEAISIFQSLVRDPAIGYYSILAYYRIQQTPGASLPLGVETRLGLKKGDSSLGGLPSEEEVAVAAESLTADGVTPDGASDGSSDAAVEEGGTTASDDVNDSAGENDEVENSAEKESESAVEGGASEEVVGPETKSFKAPALAMRFERARDFLLLGLDHLARRELTEIERLARSSDDRRRLMAEYALAGNYWRSSTIGELGFGPARLRGGLRGESRQYWEHAYPRAWNGTVIEASQSTSVPEEFIWGIMRAESHYRYDAQSPVGALGLMQIMPFTGRQVANLLSINTFETRSLLEPNTNIRLGSRYLQRLLEKFSGSIPLAAASYNAGPHRVHAWVRNFGTLDMDEFIEHIPFVETRNYVKKVARNYQIYSLLYSGGVHSLRWLVTPVGVQVDEQVPTKEIW